MGLQMVNLDNTIIVTKVTTIMDTRGYLIVALQKWKKHRYKGTDNIYYVLDSYKV